jgi:mannosyltransferase OCH1-like enzyme
MFPKIIHLTCKDKNNITNTTWKLCIEKYKKIYTNYTIKIWDNNDIYHMIQKYFPDDVEKIKKITIGAVLADIFRYFILYIEGGIYSDMDCEPVKKIDSLFTNVHYHGNNKNTFFIYPKNKPLKKKHCEFHLQPCNHCKLISKSPEK